MRNQFSTNKVFATLALLCFMLPMIAGNKQGTFASFLPEKKVVSDADKRKAEYVFLEAERLRGNDDDASYFEMLRHANKIDPTNTTISFYMGYMMLVMDKPTEERNKLGLQLMRKHYLECPEDYYETYVYGTAAQRMGERQEALEVWKKLSDIYPDKADVKFALAESYGANGNFQQAIDAYDSLENAQGKMLTLTVRKINVYLALNDSVSAVNECKSLLATAPKNVQYNLMMSRLYATVGKQDSALVYLDKAQSYEPDNGAIYLAKAQFYNSIGDTVNYDQQIYNALINKELDVDSKLEVLFDYSRDLVQSKDSSERADKLFKVLIDEHPHESKIHELYAQYLYTREDYKNAAEQMGYAVDSDPKNADNWRLLMVCDLLSENYKDAVKAGENAIKYNPDNISLYKYIGPAYHQIKEYDKALEVYNKALEIVDSNDVETRSDLVLGIGDVYYQQHDTVKAFETYEKALELNPGNVMAMNNYAYFLSEAGKDLDKAEKMSYRTIKEFPENSTYLDTYAWILFKKANYKEALVYMEKAMRVDGDKAGAEMYEHYGDILFMSGSPEEALAQWEKALKLDPDNEVLQRKVKHKTYFFK